MEQGRKRTLAPTDPPLFSFIVWMWDGVVLKELHVVYSNVNTYSNCRHIVKPCWRDKGSNWSASSYYRLAVAKGCCLLLNWTFSLLLSLPKEHICGVSLGNQTVFQSVTRPRLLCCVTCKVFNGQYLQWMNEWRIDWMIVVVQCAWVIVFVLQYYPILQIFYIYTPLSL